MSFTSLAQILQQVSAQPAWRKYKRLGIILQCWQELVGHNVAQQTRPTGIYQEVLQVATSSAVWCQELSLQRSPILSKINQILSHTHPQALLRDIHFSTARWHQLPTIAPPTRKPTPAPDILAPPADALTALQRWRHTLQQQKTPTCPLCQSYTTASDLARWGVCRFCARQRFITH